jgi:hypothetical protein
MRILAMIASWASGGVCVLSSSFSMFALLKSPIVSNEALPVGSGEVDNGNGNVNYLRCKVWEQPGRVLAGSPRGCLALSL